MRMLDLFAGSGSASRAAAVRGWDVVRIDNAPGTAWDLRADLSTWEPAPGDAYDLVWASPPCTQLSTASSRRDVDAGMVLVRAAVRIIRAIRPRWWVLENVHGATRAIGALLGPPVACHGSFYLWGVFPPFEATVARDKTAKSGRRRAERRAAIPWAISDGLVRACEQLAAELGTWSGPGGEPVGARAGQVRAPAGASSGHVGAPEDAGAGRARGELGALPLAVAVVGPALYGAGRRGA